MRNIFCLAVAAMLALVPAHGRTGEFVRIDGENLVKPDGSRLFIKGTNLGNWLNPEGYMFGLSKPNSYTRINEAFCELVGPDFTAKFWKAFKDNYITEADIKYIASRGANTIRLPFSYKLFTDEDYMGLTHDQDGFEIIDRLIGWCRDAGLYLILDMHDCPGGQTGDNIDDSFGYPWLFESESAQREFLDIWKAIAKRYSKEPVILGYELMNEPIATYFDRDYFNPFLEPLYKKAVEAIRTVDRNHIILLGGAQWNSRFDCFTDWKFDDKIMYTCHRYGGAPTKEAIKEFTDFRDRTGLPMLMGEIGHNTLEWQKTFCSVMQEVNIGWLFWPYKKLDSSCMMGISRPGNWQKVIDFAEADRSTYAAVRAARPDQAIARKAMEDFITACSFSHCNEQTDYVESICLK